MTPIPMAAVLALAFGLGLPMAAQAQQAASPSDGERLFRMRCGSCHTLEAGQNRVGPSLSGVVGRTAGSIEGARYSPALKASGLTWDEQTLDRFLANPRQTVAGTTMTVSLTDQAQRATLIGFLKSQSEVR